MTGRGKGDHLVVVADLFDRKQLGSWRDIGRDERAQRVRQGSLVLRLNEDGGAGNGGAAHHVVDDATDCDTLGRDDREAVQQDGAGGQPDLDEGVAVAGQVDRQVPPFVAEPGHGDDVAARPNSADREDTCGIRRGGLLQRVERHGRAGYGVPGPHIVHNALKEGPGKVIGLLRRHRRRRGEDRDGEPEQMLA